LAPILTSFSRRLVSDHGSVAFGSASVRMKLLRLVGQCVELAADSVGAKIRHDSRVHLIAPLSSLIHWHRRAPLVVEGDDALRRPGQVGDDEANTRMKLGGMTLDLRYHPAGFLPALRLIAEAVWSRRTSLGGRLTGRSSVAATGSCDTRMTVTSTSATKRPAGASWRA
jgi:hypothetical protein